ncbi:MAG: magnesium/cobalt transporter CorA [Acidobacteria bacterium]|nr:MAG: magnesium/cobalt transporter CorA [Acidobacteriota bacterium]
MRKRWRRKRAKGPGSSPGTLVYMGEKAASKVRLSVIDYDEGRMVERDDIPLDQIGALKETATVSWINVEGVSDPNVIEEIGTRFGLHPLLLEDILNPRQRAKMEPYDTYIFLVLKMLYVEKDGETRSEQVSFVLGPHYVISFLEDPGDIFDPVRERIRAQRGRIRLMGPDYLLYALVDAIVDHYFIVLECLEERIEKLEDEVFTRATPSTLHSIQHLKTELLYLRKSVWPLREALSGLLREDCQLLSDKTEFFFRDVYDHTIQVIDTLESLRDTVSGLLDIYLSSLSHRLNEVMKVLTIIATIFIPLTFIVGVYGMNFRFMPELDIPWAYPVVWAIMIAVGGVMLVFFRRKGWL